ncbi:MAG: hypothetical protein NTW94_01705 [Legionellales bacterium]|nr:hypothetical protein [Legionellales bacterium]
MPHTKTDVSLNWSEWFRLYVITPENAVLAVCTLLLVSTLQEKKQIDRQSVALALACPVASQVTGAFFGRMRENRDYQRYSEEQKLKNRHEEMEKAFHIADLAFQKNKYSDALKNFSLAEQLFREVFKTEKGDSLSRQIEVVCLRQAMCYFYMNHFSEALLKLDSSFPKDKKDHCDALNLRAIIYYKLSKEDEALSAFATSRKLDSTQNVVTIFVLFLQKKYAEVLTHSPFKGVGAGSCPLEFEQTPWMYHELCALFGDAALSIDPPEPEKAIAFYTEAIQLLPFQSNVLFERAWYGNQLSKAYGVLEKTLSDSVSITLTFISEEAPTLICPEGKNAPISMNKIRCAAKVEGSAKVAQALLNEAHHLFPDDPRYDKMKSIIQPDELGIWVHS